MRTLTAIAAALVLAACGSGPTSAPAAHVAVAVTPTPGVDSLTFAGIRRGYLVHRPAGVDPAKPVPLVIAMHGWTSYPADMEYMSNFDAVADQHGFVVVYPEGLSRSWNAGWCCGHNTNDDVGFIGALIDKLASDQHIDRTRILAAGMSNGAMMAQRLGCELTGKITAVLSVSGSLLVDSCHPSRPISILEMHGSDDDLVPLKGGLSPGIGTFRPTLAVMQQWASLDGCSTTPATADDAAATTYTWSRCQAGSTVALVVVKGGSHSWFGPQAEAGQPDASRMGWDLLVHAPPLA